MPPTPKQGECQLLLEPSQQMGRFQGNAVRREKSSRPLRAVEWAGMGVPRPARAGCLWG